MAEDTTITDALETAAIGPKTVEIDGRRATARDISEYVAADRYQKGVAAAKNGMTGIRAFKIIPPGAG